MTTEAVAELRAVDAALAGDPVPDEQLETAALALALRDEAPRPDPEFVTRLDAEVRDGFPAAGGSRRKRLGAGALENLRARRPRRFAPLALGSAASVFIVAIALVSSGALDGGSQPDGGDQPAGARESSPAGTAPAAGPARSTEARGSDSAAEAPRPAVSGEALSVPAPPGPVDVAPRARARKVERSASLVLAAGADRVEDVADGVIRTTDRHGGFVVSSSIASGDGAGEAGATLDLRVPSRRLGLALADLSELAHVRSRTQNATDITARFASPRRRLTEATAERQGLLRQLARAETPNETASIRARLRLVNHRIDRARLDLRRLQNRVSYSAVSVAVDSGGNGDGGGEGAWSAGDALDDAGSILGAAAGIAVLVAAVLVPLALLALGLWAGQRLYVRHRRDRALS